jgi:RNA polymerase sigma-70 factor (ECF subfamily)
VITSSAAISTTGQTQIEGARENLSSGALLNDLLVASGHHDEAAFAQFYELTSPWIYYLLVRRTGSTVRAENALCNVYVAVWRQAPSFASIEKSALAWVTTIALGLVKS